VLRGKPRDLVRAFELLCAVPEDMLAERRDGRPQARPSGKDVTPP
jgi:hypothetical protein